MVFHWSLSDSKSPKVPRTCFRILAVLNNAVVSIVSTRPPTSKFSMPFNAPLVIVPKAPITIYTIVIFMFHSFFSSLVNNYHYYYYYYLLMSFSHQRYLIVFHRSLRDSKSARVSRTLLSILADLNNVVVWRVLNCPLPSPSVPIVILSIFYH